MCDLVKEILILCYKSDYNRDAVIQNLENVIEQLKTEDYVEGNNDIEEVVEGYTVEGLVKNGFRILNKYTNYCTNGKEIINYNTAFKIKKPLKCNERFKIYRLLNKNRVYSSLSPNELIREYNTNSIEFNDENIQSVNNYTALNIKDYLPKEKFYRGEFRPLKTKEGVVLDNFEISEYGVILNTKTGKYRNYSISSTNYFKIKLMVNGKNKTYKIHQLVYASFIGDIDENLTINHIDCNRYNNHYSNLEQIPMEANLEHYKNSINQFNFILND